MISLAELAKVTVTIEQDGKVRTIVIPRAEAFKFEVELEENEDFASRAFFNSERLETLKMTVRPAEAENRGDHSYTDRTEDTYGY